MTQDDVDLVHDYLHKNYRYENGYLIRIIGANGHPIGERLGTFSFHDKWAAPAIKSVIVINKRRFSSTLAHFIWIFHHKEKPKFIEYIDGNISNTNIENLKEISVTHQYLKNTKNSKGVLKIENGAGVSWRATIQKKNKMIFLGFHSTKEEAEKAYQIAREAVSKEITCPVEIKKYVNDHLGVNKIPINKNKNGFKGVKKTKEGTYYGYSVKKGHEILTPCFKTPEEAHKAYMDFKIRQEVKNEPKREAKT